MEPIRVVSHFASMMDFLDYMLISGTSEFDDESLSYQRVVGNLDSRLMVFLPWRTSFRTAQRLQIVPDDFLACYQMPPAIVSSEPDLCADALKMIVTDALNFLSACRISPNQVVMIGMSMGSAAATRLANLTGARLCSITSADRGDLMLWQSPAAEGIRAKAQRKGYRINDFGTALDGLHPIDNLIGVRGDSLFVAGQNDLLVPPKRRDELLREVRRKMPGATIVTLPFGHFRTICSAARGFPELLAKSAEMELLWSELSSTRV